MVWIHEFHKAKYTSHHVIAYVRHITLDMNNHITQFLISYGSEAILISNHSIFRSHCIQSWTANAKEGSNLSPSESQLSQELYFLLINNNLGSTSSGVSLEAFALNPDSMHIHRALISSRSLSKPETVAKVSKSSPSPPLPS